MRMMRSALSMPLTSSTAKSAPCSAICSTPAHALVRRSISVVRTCSERLGELLATHNRHRVFRLHQGGHLGHQLLRAKLGYLGIKCPVRRPVGWYEPTNRLEWVTFHSFRHTWATWMRQH